MLTASVNTNGDAPVPPSPPSMLTKSTPRPVSRISRASSCQNAMSPTADLIPSGRPVSSASISTQSSSSSGLWNSACRDGLTQSRATGTPRVCAISGDTFAAGSSPPSPGFAPWLNFTSSARTGELAPIAVVRRDAALTGVLQAPGQRRAAVERLHRVARQRAEAHPGDVDHRVGTERAPAPARGAQHLRARQPRLLTGARRRRWRRPPERLVVDDHIAGRVLDVVVGAEAEVVVLQLGRRVHPPTLIPAKRPFLVVPGDDVLPQLRPDLLDQVASVADQREVPQDRVPALGQVVRRNGRGRGERHRRPSHGSKYAPPLPVSAQTPPAKAVG